MDVTSGSVIMARRSSAWAIYGFALAADWTGNADYLAVALRLAEACFETATEAQGLLRASSYSIPANRAVEQFMPFGDYYFLESLLTLKGQVNDFWGKASLITPKG